MKKLLLLLLSISSLGLAAAEKVFPILGRHRNVRIVKVTHRGIEISHNDGIGYLNIRTLSSRDKEKVKEEIALFNKLRANHTRQASSNRRARNARITAQSKEADALIKYLLEFECGPEYENFGVISSVANLEHRLKLNCEGEGKERFHSFRREITQKFPQARRNNFLLKLLDLQYRDYITDFYAREIKNLNQLGAAKERRHDAARRTTEIIRQINNQGYRRGGNSAMENAARDSMLKEYKINVQVRSSQPRATMRITPCRKHQGDDCEACGGTGKIKTLTSRCPDCYGNRKPSPAFFEVISDSPYRPEKPCSGCNGRGSISQEVK